MVIFGDCGTVHSSNRLLRNIYALGKKSLLIVKFIQKKSFDENASNSPNLSLVFLKYY